MRKEIGPYPKPQIQQHVKKSHGKDSLTCGFMLIEIKIAKENCNGKGNAVMLEEVGGGLFFSQSSVV